MNEEVEELVVSLVIFPPDSEDIELRQIGLGINPLILIEPTEEDGDYGFKITSSLLEQEDIAGVLEILANAMRNGEEV